MYPTPEDYPLHPDRVAGEPDSPDERARREAYLEELRPLLALEADEHGSDPRVSHRDASWQEWQARTGELPPDFEALPATAALPDPLENLADGSRITSREEWADQRERIGHQLQHWLYGRMPPAPGEVEATELDRRRAESATVRDVRLSFGPDGEELTLDLRLLVPDGEGPFPVFMTQWTHRDWAAMAVRRGFLAVVYAAADGRDDAADYGEQYEEYDFQLLARRAWAASRAVDYLEDLPDADDDRIALTGASRNGKQSLLAAAFDERIDAVAPCSAGSGATVPARFDRDDFYAGDMALHARLRRSWFHPRWRFFVGRENRLLVDANSLVSLVAPRACLLQTAKNERTTSGWAVEKVYESAKTAYDLFGAGDGLALQYREGRHARTTRDVQAILDFFDRAFDRGEYDDPTRLYHEFSFEEWADSHPLDTSEFPERGPEDLLLAGSDEGGDDGPIESVAGWERKEAAVRERLQWSLGEAPPRAPMVPEDDTGTVLRGWGSPDYRHDVIGRPESTDEIGKCWLSPSHTFGERFSADLYYPRDGGDEGPAESGPHPVVVWLHPYSYNVGYGAAGRGQVPIEEAIDRGFALCCFDLPGFGTRITEAEGFYERHPDWSKMGAFVEDALAAVESLAALEFVDAERISLLGYSLGGTVSLYAAALDDRIRSVASVCGLPHFRGSDAETERENAVIGRFSHLHGLQPRLGHFRDAPRRTPIDFDEVLGSIAPRPALAVAPSMDWTHPQADVLRCTEAAREVYDLYDAGGNFDVWAPEDLLSFDYHEARLHNETIPEHAAIEPQRRARVFDWLARNG
ncbi:alpha/beta fold hydrolase [Saliphagus infecundisoli]|uniref:Alpha/beta fold hydrolase n=1 Tax=Saliphagus infecundisoli TaxID=1849069 RepID=A0ABD5Q9V7_9EURY|nr:alpha/beta fold hydrolase [Saliphagus infecundisoli]